MSKLIDEDGAFGLVKEGSKASIASLSQGSIAHSEAPSRTSNAGSFVAVKRSAGSEAGDGLLIAPSLREAMATAEPLADEITLKADKSKAGSVRSSLGGIGQSIIVDLKPTPASTPLKTPSLRKGPGSELGLESSPTVKGSELKAVNFSQRSVGGQSTSPSIRSSSARHRSPTKEDRPDATQHIDYDAHADSPSKVRSSINVTQSIDRLELEARPQLLGTSELNKTTVGGIGFAPSGMQDTMLAVAEANTMVADFKSGLRQAGWLYKLVGKTPQDVNWKRYWFFIADDRLYFTADPANERTSGKTRYICLDRVPVRPLPHRRRHFDPTTMTTPDIGVSIVDTRVLAHLGVKLKPNTCFGIVSGAHTYFLAADTPEEARRWVKALRSTWVHCFKHTLRGTDDIDSQVQETSRLMAHNQLLTQSLREMEGKAAGADSEYWKSWLEEKAKNRQLEEQMVDLALYEVEVKTGKMKGADTDARVYIEMYGPYDQVTTGELRLVNADTHQKSYTRDGLDLFLVTAKNVSLPNSIKVWHDNTGRHPDWFLECIRIRKKDSVSKLHPSEQSFGRGTPSASPSKFGPGSGGKFLSASNTATRGAVQGAPSVFSPGRTSVVASPHKATFTLGRTSAWAVFPCGRWFSTSLEDCRISRTLFAGHSTPLIQYKVEVETSDMRGAGTEANVHLTMHGTLGDGKRHLLTSGPDDFTRGVINEFTIDDEELGELLEITIGHDNTGHSASWHLDHVIILNCKTDESFLFPCRQWFDTRIGDGLVERRLGAGDAMGKITNYTFKITTSDIRGAGTDADVHVALHGDLGDTPSTLLASRPEHFERMQTDEFQLQLPSVGKIRTLTVGHNNRGPGPDWHLQMVEVYDEDADKTYFFPCNKWLGLGVGNNLLERTLVAVEEDPRHLLTDYRLEFYTSKMRGAGTDATVYFQLVGEKGEGEVTRIVAPREAFERGTVDTFSFKFSHLGKLQKLLVQHDNSGANPAWHLFKVDVFCAKDKATTVFVCNGWIRSDQSAVHPSVELLAGRPIPLLTNYRLDIITTDMRGSGTTSNVFVELVGEMGKIGPLPLDNPDAFEKGQRDIFEIEGPDCGPLTQLILSLDGAGNRPSWNLDHALVFRDASIEDKPDDSLGVYFPCRQWFNKEMGMAKALFPMKKGEDGRLVYTFRVQTSDVKGAGTDSNIFVSLVGDKGETGYQPLVANHDTFERGNEDVFPLEMNDVGRPTFLLVKSDGASKKPTWHLDTIIVEIPGSPPAFFVGQCWIGPSTRMEIKIPVSWVNPKEDLATYKIHVYTSDVKNSGTDAGVLIEIFGDRASSGKQPLLDMSKDTFERGQMDEFKLQCKNLGGLRAIRIESDGRSNKPSWHMDRIVIISPTGEVYFFSYEDWIREGRLKVEIPASFQDPTASRRGYKVVTRTSDLFGSATDSNVFIDIRGMHGSTGKVPLKSSARAPFERGQADEFSVQSRKELGELAEIIIGTDYSGRTPAWHLEQVEVTETRSGRTWFFDCCQWFDAAEGDKKIERVLPAQHYDPRLSRPSPKRLARYQVVVATSDVTGAGTEAKVHLIMCGQDGSDTGRISLDPPKAGVPVFERGHRDVFEIQAAEVDPISMVRIGHNNAGPDGTGSWHLNFVEVTNMTTRAVYHFPCRRWLSKTEDDGKIERDLHLGPPMPEEKAKGAGSIEYVIETITSDLSGAGTDANVACILYGDGGETQTLKLESKSSMKNLFERGQTDTFTVTAKDVGELQTLKIWHDNKGLLQSASWALEMVIVYPKSNPQSKCYFYCGQWLSKEYGVERTLNASFTDPRLNMPTYTITVHTSNIAGAGTDARVHISMCGAKGESGTRELTGKGNLFEQGKADTFSFKMMDLGDLKYMDVWTDNSGMFQSPSWHLDYIEVDNSLTGTSTYFPCQAWFDKKLGDGQLKRRLTATNKDPRTFKADYRVSVWTSNISGAGTDANVFIAMYGDEGETEKINLANRGTNCFEAGHCDIFEFNNKNVGKLQKIRMGHDNTGLLQGASWHLDKVVVENLTSGESVTFMVGRWFSKSHDDFQIERDLLPSFSGGVNWRLTIVTGQDRGAGTDADVSVELFGTQGSFGPYQLAAKKGAYENGTHDVFSISAPEIGQITKLALSHNNKGPLTETLMGATWQVDYAELLNVATGEKYHFDFKCWLDTKHGLRAERPPSSVRGPTVFKSCAYSITFVTGPNNDSRMERGQVSFKLLGHKGDTGRQTLSLPQMGFQPSRVETCGPLADLPDTGSIRQLELSHTAPEPWFVTEVVAVNETTRAQGRFIVNKLIQPNTPTLIDAVEMPPVDYKVKVHTSDKARSGTSSHVFVNLYGVNGNTGRCPLARDLDDQASKRGSLPTLCRPSGGKFARNASDSFIIQGQPDVGPMQQLEVDLDTMGMSPSWHLHEIRVTNMSSGEVGVFPCDQWLSNTEADKKTLRLLDNSNVMVNPVGPQMASGDVGGHRDQSPHPAQVPFTQSLLRKMGGGVGPPGYEITFHTSNLVLAGTSAPVFFELIGDVGSSGTVIAKQTQGQFSRGCSDTFVYPRLPFLGELRQVRVGTTGEGAFPTWHLRNIEVYHEGTQSKYVFDCHNWIDKKCGFTRVLVANRIQ